VVDQFISTYFNLKTKNMLKSFKTIGIMIIGLSLIIILDISIVKYILQPNAEFIVSAYIFGGFISIAIMAMLIIVYKIIYKSF